MEKRISRLTRFEERKAYRRLILTVFGTVAIIVCLAFFGLPALIKTSLFVASLKTNKNTTIEEDTTPPFAPRLEPLGTATNSARIILGGYAEPNSSLELFLNGESIKKILVDNNGYFSTSEIILSEGENTITATAKDLAGNIGQPAESLSIFYKKTPPLLEVSQPKGGESYGGGKNEIQVIGSTEVGAVLSINNRLVMLKNDGSFIHSLTLSAGENLIRIISTDKAGNQTTIEKKVTFSP